MKKIPWWGWLLIAIFVLPLLAGAGTALFPARTA